MEKAPVPLTVTRDSPPMFPHKTRYVNWEAALKVEDFGD